MKDIPEILFQNDSLVALYKPSGLLSVPDRYHEEKLSASLWVVGKFSEARPLHRLDFETSGILLFCINPNAFGWYSDQFEKRSVSKTYLAIVEGKLLIEGGVINQPLFTHTTGKVTITKRGKESVTNWKLLESFAHHAYVKANPVTGRTHQIRVHLSSIGHPVLCDTTYGASGPFLLSTIKGRRKYKLGKDDEQEKPLFDRTALHSSVIEIADFKTTQTIRVDCPLPKDMNIVLQKLKQYSPIQK
ncbi:MAG: RNA pseudouridine synthase [Bacteroidota bacterium]|nr:RNA pseudouridine synthase [Bacteroidota bacterium]